MTYIRNTSQKAPALSSHLKSKEENKRQNALLTPLKFSLFLQMWRMQNPWSSILQARPILN